MSNRTLRVNELVQREINDILHTHWQSESVAITVTEVRVAPDLRDGRVFVSIIGDDELATKKLRWLEQNLAAAAVKLTAPEVAVLDAAVPRGLTKGDRYADMSAVNR